MPHLTRLSLVSASSYPEVGHSVICAQHHCPHRTPRQVPEYRFPADEIEPRARVTQSFFTATHRSPITAAIAPQAHRRTGRRRLTRSSPTVAPGDAGNPHTEESLSHH